MRPIDADKLAERFKASPAFRNMGYEGNFLLGIVLDLLGNAPTLDVVPREEVERIKQENAREIFECLEPSFAIGEFTGSDVFFAIRAEDYNRCRKKYTEDEK